MIFSRPTADQALALAGVFHAAALVDEIANHGDIGPKQLANSMSVLLNQNPDSVSSLYGSPDNIQLGISAMRTLLTDRSAGSATVLRYAIGIMYLARKLSNDNAKLDEVGNGIANAQRQAEHFSKTHDNVIANVAGLYQDSVSTMRMRIQVSGNPAYLQQTAIAQRVRCLLFAGIRSAFLWRQVGGKRSHLLLRRDALLAVLPK
ncbi:MAG TPA: high frequency lysogenization protein HflD [Porticoccaceae bacterium]|nr:high frequency lysogenization protein HflD [Porticoccaceae bacterium]